MANIPVTVFDCGVFLQGLMSKAGPAAACLELIGKNRVRLVMSETIMAEVKDILYSTDLRKLSADLNDEKIDGFIDLIHEKAEFVEHVPSHFSYLRDASDEPYLNLAIETKAIFLVSRDNDLLDLMIDHTAEAKEFRQRFRHLKILDPVEFLRLIREMDLALVP